MTPAASTGSQMQLEPQVIALVVLSAFLHAGWNAITKSSSDPLLNMAFVTASGGAIAGVMIPLTPTLNSAAFPYLLGSACVHFIYQLTLVRAYRYGDLSQVYPIARGIAPLGVAILAALLAAEIPSARQSLGLAIASTSIMSLGLIGRTHTRSRTAVGLALLTGTLIGLYTFVDGIGVRVGGHASSYISWMFFVDSFPILIFALLRRPGRVAGFLREEGLRATVGGMMAIAGYGAVLWAMSRGAMAPVASLREASVLIAAIIGTRLLGEPFGPQRILAAAGTVLGLLLVQL
jgi:drug/metabolite transporter (DMT)-like permease